MEKCQQTNWCNAHDTHSLSYWEIHVRKQFRPLSRLSTLSSEGFSKIEFSGSRPCTWVKDKHAYCCGTKQKQNNRTHVPSVDTSTSGERFILQVMWWYVKMRETKDFERERERIVDRERVLEDKPIGRCCVADARCFVVAPSLSLFLSPSLSPEFWQQNIPHKSIGETNSDCELLLPLCCAFTSVRSAQSVLVCPSTRTVDNLVAARNRIWKKISRFVDREFGKPISSVDVFSLI